MISQQRGAIAAVVLVAVLSMSCIDSGGGGLSAGLGITTVSYSEAELRVDTDLYAYTAGEAGVYLHAASLTVIDGADQQTFGRPAIESNLVFPLSGTENIGRISLSVPPPFADAGVFDAHCLARGRQVRLDVSLYSASEDRAGGDTVPLTELSVTSPFALSTPPPAGSFVGVSSGQTTGQLVVPPGPGRIAPLPAGRVLALGQLVGEPDEVAFTRFALGASSSYDGEAASQVRIGSDATSLYFLEPAFEAPDTTWNVSAFPHDGSPGFNAQLRTNDAEPSVWRGIGVFPTGSSVAAVVIASAPIGDETRTFTADPPLGKAYGSFRAEFDAATGTMVALRSEPRDVLALAAHPGGGEIEVSAELPPRSDQTSLRIIARDALGAVLFEHDEPALAFAAQLAVMPDGGIAVLVEDRTFGRSLRIVVLNPDGSLRYRNTIQGEEGTFVLMPDQNVLLAYRGTVNGLIAAGPISGGSQRPVPLLVELNAAGHIARADQIGCAGTLAVVASQDDVHYLITSTDEHLRPTSETTGPQLVHMVRLTN